MTASQNSNQTKDWRETNWERPLTDREKLMLATIAVLVLLIAGLYLFGDGYGIFRTSERHGYATNAYTEGISIVLTVVALNFWQKHRAREDLKRELVRNVKKRSNDTVLDAIDDLRHYGWLTGDDGLLRGVMFQTPQMQGADLRGANLRCADMSDANLKGAYLWDANLECADLGGANLSGSELFKANLTGTHLGWADLTDAILTGTNLEGAVLEMVNLSNAYLRTANLERTKLIRTNLSGADLLGANLSGANLTEAIMPNGEKYHDGMDLGKFTDPEHPEFFDPSA